MSKPGKARSAATCGRALERCSHGQGASKTLGTAATVAAVGLHAALFVVALTLGKPAPSQAARQPRQLLEVELAPPAPPVAPEPLPEPPAEPPPEPEKRIAQPKVSKPPAATPPPAVEPPPEPAKAPEPPAPAPAAAQAAQALTATEQAPSAPADTLVTGDGKQYAGGTTERGGTATHAVQASSARAFGVEGGIGNAPADRSRAPQLASGKRWDCPLPDEAQEEGVEHAVVALLVEVAPDGTLRSVEIKSDPGYGFGREARACALKKKWLPGLDRNGQPTAGKQLVNVNF